MNSLINKIKYEFREPIPKFGAIILIVGGLIMGTVFIFGMHYWEGSVPKSESPESAYVPKSTVSLTVYGK